MSNEITEENQKINLSSQITEKEESAIEGTLITNEPTKPITEKELKKFLQENDMKEIAIKISEAEKAKDNKQIEIYNYVMQEMLNAASTKNFIVNHISTLKPDNAKKTNKQLKKLSETLKLQPQAVQDLITQLLIEERISQDQAFFVLPPKIIATIFKELKQDNTIIKENLEKVLSNLNDLKTNKDSSLEQNEESLKKEVEETKKLNLELKEKIKSKTSSLKELKENYTELQEIICNFLTLETQEISSYSNSDYNHLLNNHKEDLISNKEEVDTSIYADKIDELNKIIENLKKSSKSDALKYNALEDKNTKLSEENQKLENKINKLNEIAPRDSENTTPFEEPTEEIEIEDEEESTPTQKPKTINKKAILAIITLVVITASIFFAKDKLPNDLITKLIPMNNSQEESSFLSNKDEDNLTIEEIEDVEESNEPIEEESETIYEEESPLRSEASEMYEPLAEETVNKDSEVNSLQILKKNAKTKQDLKKETYSFLNELTKDFIITPDEKIIYKNRNYQTNDSIKGFKIVYVSSTLGFVMFNDEKTNKKFKIQFNNKG